MTVAFFLDTGSLFGAGTGISPALVSVILGLQFPSLANIEFVICLYMCQFNWHCYIFDRNNKNNSTENAHLSRTQCHTSESRIGQASKPPSPLLAGVG